MEYLCKGHTPVRHVNCGGYYVATSRDVATCEKCGHQLPLVWERCEYMHEGDGYLPGPRSEWVIAWSRLPSTWFIGETEDEAAARARRAEQRGAEEAEALKTIATSPELSKLYQECLGSPRRGTRAYEVLGWVDPYDHCYGSLSNLETPATEFLRAIKGRGEVS